MSVNYLVTTTDDGQWLHAPSSDFVFAYVANDWTTDQKSAVTEAFKQALTMPGQIKKSIEGTGGKPPQNGLYILDQTAMTKAMVAIDGMGEVKADTSTNSGSKTAVDINMEFFTSVLAGLGGDVAPMLDYLNKSMQTFQAELSQNNDVQQFGTVFGLVSLMDVLDVAVTGFTYAYSSSDTKTLVVSANCGSATKIDYSYSYTVVDYVYEAPTTKPIGVTLQALPGTSNQFATIDSTRHDVPVELRDGTHTFRSAAFPIGTLHSYEQRPLDAYLTFTYTYDQAGRTVTVCDTDFESADGLRLVTYPRDTLEYCHHRAAGSGGFRADDLAANVHWNLATPALAGVRSELARMARAANQSLIAELEAVPGLTVRVRREAPELASAHYLNLLVVYRDNEFLEVYRPDGDYGDRDVVHPLESVYGGTAIFDYGTLFANVIGSDPDPKPAKSWIELWRKAFDLPTPKDCASLDYHGFDCGDDILGGHIILGTKAAKVTTGSDGVYIIPICKQHNNDDRVGMAVVTNGGAVWLKRYMQS